jgi:hypothetical protein
MASFPTAQNAPMMREPYRSYKALVLYDCADRRSATIQQHFYSEERGAGSPVHRFSVPEQSARFEEVVPDSIGASNLREICERVRSQSNSRSKAASSLKAETLPKGGVVAQPEPIVCTTTPENVTPKLCRCKDRSGSLAFFSC